MTEFFIDIDFLNNIKCKDNVFNEYIHYIVIYQNYSKHKNNFSSSMAFSMLKERMNVDMKHALQINIIINEIK
jgi:hypothetical protein